MPIEVGGQIGAYRIESQLGQGGVGTVYHAFDTTLRRPVAIKVLPEADEQARSESAPRGPQRLGPEPPNGATARVVGEQDSQAYIVMELVEGKPLSELTAADDLPKERHPVRPPDR